MNKIIFWSVIFFLSSCAIYILSGTLLPFLIAFIFAYLLQPVIDNNYKRFKLPRSLVTLIVFILFLGAFAAIMALLIPMIYQQIALFVTKVPQYKLNFELAIFEWSEYLKSDYPELSTKLLELAQTLINSMFSLFSSFADYIWQYTLATISFFTIAALVPIILFYFLRDWPIMVSSIESVIPMRGKSKISQIFASINELLSAYIRGQLNICIMLSVYYVIGLYFIGLDLALLLGIISGFFVIIPFIGAFISFLLVMTSGYFAFGSGVELLYIAIFFAVGHAIEGYILAPKIIGDKIGLHPLWIIFTVFAAGSLFGIMGIILAIPIAGIVKVLLHHMLDYYKSSSMYKE